jgi:hypothetical protein
MVQIVATLASLLIAISAVTVIGLSLAEDWDALKRALLGRATFDSPPLPPRTYQVASARRARIVRMTPGESPVRVAA